MKGPLVSLAALFFLRDNQFTLGGIVLWILGIVFFWREISEDRSAKARLKTIHLKELLVLTGVVLLAFFFRFYRLDLLPATMNEDVLSKILYIINKIKAGDLMIYSAHADGRETLFMYLMTALSYIVPLRFLTFKLVTAFIGAVTVIPFYFFLKRLASSRVALFGSFFLAVGKWHIAISRMGYRLILAPFFAACFLFFLVKALQTRQRKNFFLAGLFFGGGLWTYPNFQFLLPAVAVFFLLMLLRNQNYKNRQLLSNIGIFTVIVFLIVLPLVKFIYYHPAIFFKRGLSRIISAEVVIENSPTKIFLHNLGKTALMFNVRGENERATNIPYDPQLDWITGIFFLVGLYIAAVKIRKRALFLLLLLGLLFTASAAAFVIAFPVEVPNGRRTIIASLFAYGLAGFGFDFILYHLRRVGRLIYLLLLTFLFMGIFLLNFVKYFYYYPEGLPLYNFPFQQTMVGEIKKGGREKIYYISTIGYWNDERFIGVELGDRGYDLRKLTTTTQFVGLEKENVVFFLFPTDNQIEGNIRRADLAITEKFIYTDSHNRPVLIKITSQGRTLRG